MATADQGSQPDEPDPIAARGRRRWPLALAALAAVLIVALAWAWLSRERIADDFLDSQLEEMGLPATYEIEDVGPVRQILRNVVIGDPQSPDLVVERVEASIRYRFGVPTIGRITLVRPRLYGTQRGGKLSFGSLDEVLFDPTEPEQPFQLPDLDVRIVDGRALIASEFGRVGVKLEGAGPLRDGFRGTLAAIAPEAAVGDCRLVRASLYGTIGVADEQPRFAGPLRLGRVTCSDGPALENVALRMEGTLDRGFDGGEGTFALETGTGRAGGVHAAGFTGTGRFAYRGEALTARYEIAAASLSAAAMAARTLEAEGSLRSQNGLDRIEIEGSLAGGGLALGAGLDQTLVTLQRGAEGTLLEPLLGQVRTALRRETAGSRVTASYLARLTDRGLTLTVPQANLRGGSGQTLLAVSRFQISAGNGGTPRIAGNLVTGGAGLPRISGRMERPSGGEVVLRLRMAEYQAGAASLAVPQLLVAQGAGGALGFAGRATLSGPLPGGSADNLILPIDGNWSNAGGLALWRSCTPVAFDRLSFANLTLDRRRLTVCPARGRAIVSVAGGETRIAAGAAGLDLTGRLGSTPIRIASGPVGFAQPGTVTAQAVDVLLGDPATASSFRLTNLTARVGEDIAGSFDGADVRLAAVPLDLLEAHGSWRYADGALTIADGAFRLIDRRADARFEPLVGQGGTLVLANDLIEADALLVEPEAGREVTRVTLSHDLDTGRGRADLAVAGVRFDEGFQPVDLTRLALGVVANARGSVRGRGQIVWTPAAITSTGRFTTDALDFAAAFGPVKGASGTLVFTDLLGLVSAPDQRLQVASINPGIEVTDGEIRYELRPNSRIAILGGRWPFLDGTLTLEPTALNIGIAEVRRYTLRVEGIDAAKFVQRLEIPNVNATGIFDGALPLVFDESGGRIEGGALASRPPGGNVSYVGALTYENLSTMANFAFDALKSLDYREMRVGMDGALTGEIVTRVRFSGVKQGAGAKQNFITRRLANLPLQFNINLRAPFYQIITSFKGMYDPAYVKDPRELGLVDAQGRRLAPSALPAPPVIQPSDIQPSDSEKRP